METDNSKREKLDKLYENYMTTLKWIETKNVTKTFRLGDEPELIHVIKTGFEDKYMLIYEDAYDLNTGDIIFGTKIEIENKFGISL